MADEANLEEIRSQLNRLDESSAELRGSIETLTVPLATIAEIQKEQQAIRAAAAEASTKAEEVELKSESRARRARQVAAGALVVLLLLVGSTYLNRRAIAASQARWCPVVLPLAPRTDDPPPVGTPEQQERALRIRVAFTHLVHDFDCK